MTLLSFAFRNNEYNDAEEEDETFFGEKKKKKRTTKRLCRSSSSSRLKNDGEEEKRVGERSVGSAGIQLFDSVPCGLVGKNVNMVDTHGRWTQVRGCLGWGRRRGVRAAYF